MCLLLSFCITDFNCLISIQICQSINYCFLLTDLVQFLPLITDARFLQDIHDELTKEGAVWVNVGVRDTMMFAWAITLRNLAQQPEMQGETQAWKSANFPRNIIKTSLHCFD